MEEKGGEEEEEENIQVNIDIFKYDVFHSDRKSWNAYRRIVSIWLLINSRYGQQQQYEKRKKKRQPFWSHVPTNTEADLFFFSFSTDNRPSFEIAVAMAAFSRFWKTNKSD